MPAVPEPSAVDLHVEERGAGRPVVLVHGWSFSSSAMAPLAEALSTWSRVLSVDLRGHGRSPAPEGFHDVRIAAQDLARVLDRAGLERALLVGWSWGAEVALAAAASLRPGTSKLAGLALLSATPRFCTSAPEASGDGDWPHGTPEANVRALSRRLARDPAGTRRLFAEGMFVAGEPRPPLLEALLAEPLAIHAARATLDALAAADLRADAADLAGLPVLLVHGGADPVVPPAASAWLARTIPGAHRHELPGLGHAPHLSRPDLVAPLLEDFLASLPRLA
jgi:pimeloyl-[acyl-carrier protein] methyl ester esterase